jgi:hypothetical protein
LDAHAGLWKVEDFLYKAAIAVPRNIEMLCTCAGAVDNTLYLDAHAGLWKVEDFLYRAAIAVPRNIEML